MRMHWVWACLVLACVSFTGHAKAVEVNLVGAPDASDGFGSAMAAGDFDCDGDDDLVVGVKGEDGYRGAINVVYSGSGGLGTSGNRLYKYRSFGEGSGGEWFGLAVAAGDFNADGCDDVAVGAQGAGVGGVVVVAYGGSGGIVPDDSELWDQDSAGVGDVAEVGDAFGQTLLVADFDDDGFDDLVIGSPFEDVGSIESAGAINVLYGSASGVTDSGDQFFHLDTSGVQGGAGAFEHFSYSLASGDFNGDGRADLAVGAHGDHVDGIHNAGSVLILPGSATGLTANGDQFITRKTLGFVAGFDLFSYAIAAGDFDGNGMDDLAIGAPADPAFGAVHVLPGTASGLSVSGAQYWTQSTPGVPGTGASGDFFGGNLVAGNFNGGSQDDLAIANWEDVINGFERAGAVTVLYGSSSGLATQPTVADFIFQDQTNDDDVEEFDKFGSQLAMGDFDGNGFDDLLVGVPLESVSGIGLAGAVHVYLGSSIGPKRDSTSQFLRQ